MVQIKWFIFTEELPHSIWNGFSTPPLRQNSVWTSLVLRRGFPWKWLKISAVLKASVMPLLARVTQRSIHTYTYSTVVAWCYIRLWHAISSKFHDYLSCKSESSDDRGTSEYCMPFGANTNIWQIGERANEFGKSGKCQEDVQSFPKSKLRNWRIN